MYVWYCYEYVYIYAFFHCRYCVVDLFNCGAQSGRKRIIFNDSSNLLCVCERDRSLDDINLMSIWMGVRVYLFANDVYIINCKNNKNNNNGRYKKILNGKMLKIPVRIEPTHRSCSFGTAHHEYTCIYIFIYFRPFYAYK